MKKFTLITTLFIGLALLSIPVLGTYAEAAETPQRGGTLKVIASRSTKALGAPWEGDNWYHIYGTMAVEALLQRDKDGKILPHLATAWKIAPDGKSITLELRKGVKFHDGTDFNAAAVKYSLESQTVGTLAARRESIDVIDDYTVRINLKQYDSSLLSELTSRYGMVVSLKAAQKKTTAENQARDHMVGTGAYTYVDWSRDEYIKYKRFDGYWQKGKPYLDAFEIIFIQDPVTSILAFESGAAQLIMRIEPKAAKDLQAKGYEILSITYGSKSLTPDGANADSPWSNRKAREALNYAIDRKAVSDAIGLGYWFPLYQAAPEGYIGHFTDVESFKYDPARAKKLLAEAGFPNGFSTTILSKAEENHDLLVAIQTYLADIGIKAKIELLDRGRYVANHKEGWHNGIMYGTFGGRPSEEKASNLRIITTKMPYNKPVYSPPGFEETFDKAVGTWDPEEENRLTEKLYRMVYEESMIIPLWRETQLAAQTKNVHDSGWCAVASTAWYPENAWLSK